MKTRCRHANRCDAKLFFSPPFVYLFVCLQIRQLGATLEQEDFTSGEPLLPGPGAIEFEHVSASYRPDLPLVLEDVSFSVGAGEKVAICGRTGSGKSTLGRVLLRLVP